MEIWGTVIKDSSITGIGPLMIEQHPNEFERRFDNTRRFFFNIHLTIHSIKIESHWLKLGFGDEPTEEYKTARQEYETLRADYKNVKEKIEDLIK